MNKFKDKVFNFFAIFRRINLINMSDNIIRIFRKNRWLSFVLSVIITGIIIYLIYFA